MLPLEDVKCLFLRPRVTETNKGCTNSKVTILKDKVPAGGRRVMGKICY